MTTVAGARGASKHGAALSVAVLVLEDGGVGALGDTWIDGVVGEDGAALGMWRSKDLGGNVDPVLATELEALHLPVQRSVGFHESGCAVL